MLPAPFGIADAVVQVEGAVQLLLELVADGEQRRSILHAVLLQQLVGGCQAVVQLFHPITVELYPVIEALYFGSQVLQFR